jgi:hypothetical protein
MESKGVSSSSGAAVADVAMIVAIVAIVAIGRRAADRRVVHRAAIARTARPVRSIAAPRSRTTVPAAIAVRRAPPARHVRDATTHDRRSLSRRLPRLDRGDLRRDVQREE